MDTAPRDGGDPIEGASRLVDHGDEPTPEEDASAGIDREVRGFINDLKLRRILTPPTDERPPQ